MDKYVAYGDWFTYNACPNCGHSGAILLDYTVITARRAYTKKSIIPFMSKWEYQLKDRKDRFTTGNCGISSTFRSAANNAASMNLTTAAAIVSIF